MRPRPRSISITSGKGGTGKTTLAANLGVALSAMGKKVTILDADLTMANLALVMGIDQIKASLLDVIKGRAKLSEALRESHGVRLLPAGFRFEDAHEALAGVDRKKVRQVIQDLLSSSDFILIDAPAGLQETTILSMAAAKEMLLVCNPTYTSIVDGYKVLRFAGLMGCWARGVVVNRVERKSEVPPEEIEEFLSRAYEGIHVLTEIPEDRKVQEAELHGMPFVVYDPDCKASEAIYKLAEIIVGKADPPQLQQSSLTETSERLIRVLTGKL
ncbi:MAG: cell division ATPase MinD [Candidatus Hadarchaeales archaeon]